MFMEHNQVVVLIFELNLHSEKKGERSFAIVQREHGPLY